jgi:hypothetical protein
MDEKKKTISDCCDGETYFCPPSQGKDGFFVCQTCMKGCTVHIVDNDVTSGKT